MNIFFRWVLFIVLYTAMQSALLLLAPLYDSLLSWAINIGFFVLWFFLIMAIPFCLLLYGTYTKLTVLILKILPERGGNVFGGTLFVIAVNIFAFCYGYLDFFSYFSSFSENWEHIVNALLLLSVAGISILSLVQVWKKVRENHKITF